VRDSDQRLLGYDLPTGIESFNGKLRDELLAREVFDTPLEAKVLIERWRKGYNTVQLHSSLGYRPPAPETTQSVSVAEA